MQRPVWLSPGCPVRITSGPFESFEGTVDEIDDDYESVRVLVPLNGKDHPVNVPWRAVSLSG
jgi:transcription antitermination factor NusG